MKKTKMPLEQHRDTARELHALSDRLQALLLATQPHVTKAKLHRFIKAEYAIDSVRCVMDDQLCRDWPDQFDPHVYYPGAQRP